MFRHSGFFDIPRYLYEVAGICKSGEDMADTDGSVAISIDLTVDKAEKELVRLKKRFLSLQADVTESKVRKTALEKEFEQVSAQLDEIRAKNKYGVIPANDVNASIFKIISSIAS